MKRLFLLLLVVLLAACGGYDTNTPNEPDDNGTISQDTFKVTFAPKKEDFQVGKGETGTLTITADITKPEEVAKLSIYVSSGVTYIHPNPTDGELRDGDSLEIQITVDATVSDNRNPFITVMVEGLNAKGESVTEQVRQDYQWTLE